MSVPSISNYPQSVSYANWAWPSTKCINQTVARMKSMVSDEVTLLINNVSGSETQLTIIAAAYCAHNNNHALQ
ncbi:hypothetical protein SAMN05421544_10726 [Riemerella columbipharyngis]|uniref:Uncharacterized protein n=1 Tax=Riemerella columbipharyngis TaxID=1071918 RepID=A0A1G7C1P2_9FLAO|nr:hypothetical protein SAMN05421544_10726 [Riemerella columbipharyngis]